MLDKKFKCYPVFVCLLVFFLSIKRYELKKCVVTWFQILFDNSTIVLKLSCGARNVAYSLYIKSVLIVYHYYSTRYATLRTLLSIIPSLEGRLFVIILLTWPKAWHHEAHLCVALPTTWLMLKVMIVWMHI